MDLDDYATMSEDYKIVEDDYRRTPSTFFSSREMQSDMVIKKEEIDFGDISGNPDDMKQIRRTRIANSDNEVSGNSESRFRDHLPRGIDRGNNRRNIDHEEIIEPDSPVLQPRRLIRPSQAIQNQFRQPKPPQIPHLSEYEDRRNEGSCSSSACGLKPVKNVDYTTCPICSQKYIQTCNCQNHDSLCPSGHKWYVKNGVIKLGHSH